MKYMSQTSDDIIDTDADDIPIAANRRVLVLRALRIGGLIAALPSTVLAVVWWNSFPLPHDLLRSFLQLLLPLPALWVASALVRKVYLWFDNKFARRIWRGARKFFASLVAVYTIALTGWHVHRWGHFYADFSFSIIVLLTLAALTVALGLSTAVDLWLRGIRDQRDVLPGEPDDPARFRPFRPDANDEDDSGSSQRRGHRYWGRRFIALLAPALALTLALLLVHDTSNPVIQTTAHTPDGPLPTRPTRIGSRIAWEKDVPGLLDIAAGVTGPLILTPEGLTAVNPADGSTLWSYHRTGAQYVSLREGMWYNMFGPGRYRSYLLTNPNGRYVAFRIDAPDGLEQGGKEIRDGILTIIIDTATGQVTSERLTEAYSTLQLTDTAFFDGRTAYNLSDGQARWTLEAGETEGDKFFTGPAGHNSFVLSMRIEPFSGQQKVYDLIVASDKDPSQKTKVPNFPEADENPDDVPVSINGWTVQYAEKVDDPDHYTARQVQAVSFDSLAGLEDAPAVDLGKTFGPNVVASHASGTVALYPEDKYDPADTAQQVGTVFDPATRTVTPASGCAGPVAVRLGITRVADGGAVSRALAIRPCDGSDGLTLPVVPGPFRPPTTTERSAPRQLSKRSQQEQIATMMNVPGVTLVVFNPEGEIKANGTSDIDRKYPCHLYALAGDAS